MSVSSQLFELQEVDLQAEARERAVARMTAELGDSDALRDARVGLAEEQVRLDGLATEQRSLEWEIEDISGKQANFEKNLYSGRIRVPKELTSLQQEVAALKGRRSQLEDRSLGLMEQIEASRAAVARLKADLERVETAWRARQAELGSGIEVERQVLAGLARKQQDMAGSIDSAALQTYRALRKQKGSAVARVEQGICRGCRISLPSSELQRARGGSLVQCSSCGRILYLP
jgi:predicted  nucleic acid-binding Zn-ribbon protein